MTLESRIPQIIEELPGNVKEGMVDGLKPIARAMGAHAPDTSDERDEAREFHARPVEGKDEAAVFADDWQWFFAEYGTVNEPARPFMRPAVEAGREGLNAAVLEKLNRL